MFYVGYAQLLPTLARPLLAPRFIWNISRRCSLMACVFINTHTPDADSNSERDFSCIVDRRKLNKNKSLKIHPQSCLILKT